MSCPGYFTPSEAFAALRAGAHALKLFPAEAATPAVLKAQLAVIPKDVPIMVVGGVKPDNMGPGWKPARRVSARLGASSSPAQSAAQTLQKARAYVAGLTAMKPIGIAILGFGKIAADQHVPAIEANDRLELVASSAVRAGRRARPLHRLARADPQRSKAWRRWRSRRRRGRVTRIAAECAQAGLHVPARKAADGGSSR